MSAVVFGTDVCLRVLRNRKVRIFSRCPHPEGLSQRQKTVAQAADLTIPIPEAPGQVIADDNRGANVERVPTFLSPSDRRRIEIAHECPTSHDVMVRLHVSYIKG